MRTPYGLEITENCSDCRYCSSQLFRELPPETLRAFNSINSVSVYPKEAVLFVEGQSPRGIFVVCTGRVKLMIGADRGKKLLLKIAEAGEVLGLAETILNMPYEVTVETLVPSQVDFVHREDFLSFIREHTEACHRVVELLGQHVHASYKQFHSFGITTTAGEKLARVLLDWCVNGGEETPDGVRVQVMLTNVDIAGMIGATRETVSRLMRDLKDRRIIDVESSTLFIRDKTALEIMAKS